MEKGTTIPFSEYKKSISKIDPSEVDENGSTILHHFVDQFLEYGLIFNQEKEFLDMLVDHGIDVNAQDIDGNTALHMLSFHGNNTGEEMNLARYLIKKGANIFIKNNDGEIPDLKKLKMKKHSFLKK